MSSWAKVGANCVCIKEGEWVSKSGPAIAYPIKGRTYTVREVFIGEYLVLDGLDDRDCFNVKNFRPLIAKTQSEDIEMFLRIASKAPSNMETADA